jgi:hypothetical protein
LPQLLPIIKQVDLLCNIGLGDTDVGGQATQQASDAEAAEVERGDIVLVPKDVYPDDPCGSDGWPATVQDIRWDKRVWKAKLHFHQGGFQWFDLQVVQPWLANYNGHQEQPDSMQSNDDLRPAM